MTRSGWTTSGRPQARSSGATGPSMSRSWTSTTASKQRSRPPCAGELCPAPMRSCWSRSPLNFDLGARVQTASVYAEGFVFRNFLKNGIQLPRTDRIADDLPVFLNVNVSEMTITGVELTLGARLRGGLSIGAGFTCTPSQRTWPSSGPSPSEASLSRGWRSSDRLSTTVGASTLRFAGRDGSAAAIRFARHWTPNTRRDR